MIQGNRKKYGFKAAGQRAVASVALLLFTLQAMLPTGFMINPDALRDGRYEVVICTGVGLKTITVDRAGNPVETDIPSSDHADKSNKCPFAPVAGKPLATAEAPAFVPLSIAANLPFAAAAFSAPPRGVAYGALGSRAPPHILG